MRRIPLSELRLAARAAMTLLQATIRLRVSSVEAMKSWANQMGSGSLELRDLRIAFQRAASRSTATCLVRALALQRLLAQNGHRSELRIGVASQDGALKGHAWLVDPDGDILVGAGDEAASFTLIAKWADDELTEARERK